MAPFSVHADSPWEFLWRTLAVVGIALLVCLAFWKHSGRRMQEINSRFGLVDETGRLTPDERDHVRSFIADMRRRYGLEVRVQIAAGLLSPPDADDKTLYLGLSIRSKTAVVQLPPLVARALGPDFANALETEHFPFYFDPSRDWRQGLVLAIDLIRNRLADFSSEQKTAEQEAAQRAVDAARAAEQKAAQEQAVREQAVGEQNASGRNEQNASSRGDFGQNAPVRNDLGRNALEQGTPHPGAPLKPTKDVR